MYLQGKIHDLHELKIKANKANIEKNFGTQSYRTKHLCSFKIIKWIALAFLLPEL